IFRGLLRDVPPRQPNAFVPGANGLTPTARPREAALARREGNSLRAGQPRTFLGKFEGPNSKLIRVSNFEFCCSPFPIRNNPPHRTLARRFKLPVWFGRC